MEIGFKEPNVAALLLLGVPLGAHPGSGRVENPSLPLPPPPAPPGSQLERTPLGACPGCVCQGLCLTRASLPPQFISLHENGQGDTDGVSERAIAELWLQHSLQYHCLSAQLRPLLGDRQYIRKFYTGKQRPHGPSCVLPRCLPSLMSSVEDF